MYVLVYRYGDRIIQNSWGDGPNAHDLSLYKQMHIGSNGLPKVESSIAIRHNIFCQSISQ